jgi:hypothetical protein
MTKTRTTKNEVPNNVPAVPNGTVFAAINEPLLPLIQQYRQFSKAGAVGIIDQCRTLVFAKNELSPNNFKRFCEAIKVVEKSSTFKKLCAIGEVADRFHAVIDRVPNTWTTLYQLAKLTVEEFDRLVTSGVLHASMTADELNAAITNDKDHQAKYTLVVDLTTLNEGVRVEAFNKMREAASMFGAKVKPNKTLLPLIPGWSETDNDQVGRAA